MEQSTSRLVNARTRTRERKQQQNQLKRGVSSVMDAAFNALQRIEAAADRLCGSGPAPRAAPTAGKSNTHSAQPPPTAAHLTHRSFSERLYRVHDQEVLRPL